MAIRRGFMVPKKKEWQFHVNLWFLKKKNGKFTWIYGSRKKRMAIPRGFMVPDKKERQFDTESWIPKKKNGKFTFLFYYKKK